MKKQFLFLIISILLSVMAMAQQRETFWLRGGVSTSASWTKTKFDAQAEGYNFTEVNDHPYTDGISSNTIVEWASFFNQRLVDNNHNDVLGIGHDAGGLILRYMDMNQQSTRLSAMILVGVPNQGGGMFENLLSADPPAPSPAQVMLNSLISLRTQSQNCSGCQTMERAQAWINTFSIPGLHNYYSQMKPNGPTITNMTAPSIPFAVIWGNEDDDARTLTRIMNSYHNTGTGLNGVDTEFIDCMEQEIRQRLIAAGQQFYLGTLTAIGQLAGASAKVNVLNPASAGAVIQGQINALVTALSAAFNLHKEIREMMECKLIHEALNAKWNLMLSPYEIVEETVTVEECDCAAECDDEPDPQVLAWCYQNCIIYGCTPVVSTQTFTYAVYQPHDGLLTRDEQLLEGAAVQPYEAKGCNHLQEQYWSYDPVKSAFTDLFNGGAGAAFVVPK